MIETNEESYNMIKKMLGGSEAVAMYDADGSETLFGITNDMSGKRQPFEVARFENGKYYLDEGIEDLIEIGM